MSKLYLADPSGYDVKMNEIARHFSHKVEVYPPGSCPITMQISMLRTAALVENVFRAATVFHL